MKRQRGFSLVELSIVATIVTAGVAIVVGVGSQLYKRNQIEETVNAVSMYHAMLGAEARGQTTRTYTSAQIAALPNTPQGWIDTSVSPAVAMWPWRTPIAASTSNVLQYGNRADTVILNVSGLDRSVCEGALPLLAQRSIRLSNTDGTVVRANANDPVTAAEVTTLCSATAALLIESPI